MRVILEDSIMEKGKPATAGSKILTGFVAPFGATVADRLESNGHEIVGRVDMNEFGLPKFGTDETPAAVTAVLEGIDAALTNDLFGTYRRHAAKNGLFYIHPTYGTVSRYGLIPLASSMDQIGVVCKDIRGGFELLRQIAGNDPNDGAMLPPAVGTPYMASAPPSIGTYGSLKHTSVHKQVFQILTCAEISHNINRYDGIKFGHRAASFRGVNDLYVKTRSEGFGAEVKLTAIMGAILLSKDYYGPYYEKAMKIRRLIKQDAERLLQEFNVIETPPDSPLPALCGLPSLTFSHGGEVVQLITNAAQEHTLLAAWEVLTK